MSSSYIRSPSAASEDVVGYELALLQPIPSADDLDEEYRSSSDFEDHYTQANQENEYLRVYDSEFSGDQGEEDEAQSPSRAYHEAGERPLPKTTFAIYEDPRTPEEEEEEEIAAPPAGELVEAEFRRWFEEDHEIQYDHPLVEEEGPSTCFCGLGAVFARFVLWLCG
jgi:hypothetical protein